MNLYDMVRPYRKMEINEMLGPKYETQKKRERNGSYVVSDWIIMTIDEIAQTNNVGQ